LELNKFKQENLDLNYEVSRLIKENAENNFSIVEMNAQNKVNTDKIILLEKEVNMYKGMYENSKDA